MKSVPLGLTFAAPSCKKKAAKYLTWRLLIVSYVTLYPKRIERRLINRGRGVKSVVGLIPSQRFAR